MSFLGPEGIADRIAQIQSRLDALSPRPAQASEGFQKTLGAALDAGPLDPTGLTGTPISGPIGKGQGLESLADEAAERHGLDPDVFRALVHQESGWNTGATSGKGAKGLCQLMDGTARDLGVSNPYDPAQALDGGARYLRRMMDMNHGDVKRALASYNAGFGRVNGRSEGEWPRETRHYVATILAHADRGRV